SPIRECRHDASAIERFHRATHVHVVAPDADQRSRSRSRRTNLREDSSMNALHDKAVDTATFASRSGVGGAASDFAARPQRASKTALRSTNWQRRSEKWRALMVAAQGGERQAYETLLRELDAWLRRYYARRLPAAAAEDARQDALLAIHAKRHAYAPSKPF